MRNRLLLLGTILIFLYSLLLSCTDEKDDEDVIASSKDLPNVYIAGNCGNIALVWYEGKEINLTNGQFKARANSVYVIGSDIYVAGYEFNVNGVSVAKYWKNGNAFELTNGTNAASANSIVVNGTDVYVAGTEVKNGKITAKYWKNGVETILSDINYNAEAKSICIDGSDVYVSGTENSHAIYWKNNVPIILCDTSDCLTVPRINVINGDVYVGGSFTGSRNVYWKNGKMVDLYTDFNDNYKFYSFNVVGSDVYALMSMQYSMDMGYSYQSTFYLKNGVEINLSYYKTTRDEDPIGEVMSSTSMVVSGSDLYFVGNRKYGNKAFCRKNNKFYSLSKTVGTIANDIFVK